MDELIEDFYKYMANVNLNAYGVIDQNNIIHTFGTDSKIIGRVFEMFTQPVLEKIAKKHRLKLETAKSQTVYPDFILLTDSNSTSKIAIDVKTTYIKNNSSKIKFTLGSYGSYMRNNTKNIEYKYSDYSKHYVIGFIYKRNGRAQESIGIPFEKRNSIEFPYIDVYFFMQEKFKIAGDKPGSGNTENIGSISSSNLDDFKFGKGPFSRLGHEVYDIYWKFYPKYRMNEENAYHSLYEFKEWCASHRTEIETIDSNYDSIIKLIDEYVSAGE